MKGKIISVFFFLNFLNQGGVIMTDGFLTIEVKHVDGVRVLRLSGVESIRVIDSRGLAEQIYSHGSIKIIPGSRNLRDTPGAAEAFCSFIEWYLRRGAGGAPTIVRAFMARIKTNPTTWYRFRDNPCGYGLSVKKASAICALLGTNLETALREGISRPRKERVWN